METVKVLKKDRLSNVLSYIKKFNIKELETLENQLKMMFLERQIDDLKGTVTENDFTMEEIVKEVKKVRHARK